MNMFQRKNDVCSESSTLSGRTVLRFKINMIFNMLQMSTKNLAIVCLECRRNFSFCLVFV